MKAIVFNHIHKQWVCYQNPMNILQTHDAFEVRSILQKAEKYAQLGYHSVGFCTYESATAFETTMQVHRPQTSLPLCYFAVYQDCSPFDLEWHLKNKHSATININWQPSIGKAQYNTHIQQIKQHLRQGDCYQINYTYRLQGAFHTQALDYFLQIIPKQKTQLATFLESNDWAICSASPELFFHLDGCTLHSRPMKGTLARGQSPEEDKQKQRWLQQSTKNKAENTMIVDMIRNDLSRIADKGSVNVTQLHVIEKYQTALQMTSTVYAQTNASITNIFDAMFPCASITGAPKIKAMDIIAHLEQQPRHIYTGSIGYILPDRKAQFNVAIRTVYIDKHQSRAEFGLGGGIVWDSQPDEEYQESMVKARLLF